jgi:RND superfamily putative drug exporter
VADLPQPGDDAALTTLSRKIAAQPGVAAVTPSSLNPEKDTAVIQVYPTSSPQSEATTQLLDRLRSDVVPPVERSSMTRPIRAWLAAS